MAMAESTPKKVLAELFGNLYWWACVAFWVGAGLDLFQQPSRPFNPSYLPRTLRIWTDAVSFHWHIASDPVLSFILDFVICLTALALVPGIIVVGLWLIAAVLVLWFVFLLGDGLLALAKLSPTGAIISALIALGIVWLAVRNARGLLRPLRAVASALFGVLGVLSAGSRRYSPAAPRESHAPSSGAGTWSDGSSCTGHGAEKQHPTHKAYPKGVLEDIEDAVTFMIPETPEHKAERHEAAYAAGARDAKNAGIVDHAFDLIGETLGTVMPSTSEHDSYKAGFHGKNKPSKKK